MQLSPKGDWQMAGNWELDDKLIERARKLGGHKTKRDAVTRALHKYVQWLEQQAIVSEFGKIDYDPKYDFEKQHKVACGKQKELLDLHGSGGIRRNYDYKQARSGG